MNCCIYLEWLPGRGLLRVTRAMWRELDSPSTSRVPYGFLLFASFEIQRRF
jgi:hypothetical protein